MKKKLVAYSVLFSTENLDDPKKLYVKFLNEDYIEKHKLNISEFIGLVQQKKSCPFCDSSNFKKNGKYKNGNQKYICKDCGKTFSDSTNTFFFSSKVNIRAWFAFVNSIVSNSTLDAACQNAKIARNTGFIRRKRIFLALQNYQNDIILDNKLSIDETYIKVEEKSRKKIVGGQGSGCYNNYSVCLGISNRGYIFAFVCKKNKINQKRANEIYLNHIKKGSTLIHDGEKTHMSIVKALNLEEKVIKSTAPNDERAEMKYIDELCSAVKHFLEVHRGYRKADLQNYLNLYVYIHNERIRYKKCQSKVASKLLKVVFSTKNNYFYNKKSRK